MNLLFDQFLSNRVDVSVSALGPGLFGSSQRTKQAKTVLVGDGAHVCALLHVRETPFTLAIPPFGCDTAAVYTAWDELGGPHGCRSVDVRQRTRVSQAGRRASRCAGRDEGGRADQVAVLAADAIAKAN